jgi:hypothetical protein
MNSGFLDMFHNATNHDSLAVANSINIYFNGVVQKAIE